MADLTKPTATATAVKKPAAPQKKGGNLIATLAPIACIIAGYVIWRFVLGNESNFKIKDPGTDFMSKFWPNHKGPIGAINKMYEGGIVVPILIGSLLVVLTFVVERLLTVAKASGTGSNTEFIRKVQFHLANKEIDSEVLKLLWEELDKMDLGYLVIEARKKIK